MDNEMAIPVTGWSMAPLLWPGDRVLLGEGPVRVGDVVVIRAPERLVVHRVVALVGGDGDAANWIVTRGDRVRRCDAPVPPSAILGRVIDVERAGTRPSAATAARRPRWWPWRPVPVASADRASIKAWLCRALLAGAAPGPCPAAGDPPLPRGDAWPAILATARQEGVAGLLYAALRTRGRLGDMPADGAQALASAYFQTLAATTLAVTEGVGVQQALAERGVDAVALKGLALAATIYQDGGQRPLGDLDLLVAPADMATAEATLTALGYALLPHYARRGPHRFLAERAFLRTTPPRMQIDLHHAPWSRPGVNTPALTAWLWAHTVTRTTPAGPLRTLDATANLLHVALHAAFQDGQRGRLIRHYDLARMLAVTAPDWPALAAIAQQARVAPALAATLHAAATAWTLALPDGANALAPTGWHARLHCALVGARTPALRWLVDGLAQGSPATTLATWAAVLVPDCGYRAWRSRIGRRGR